MQGFNRHLDNKLYFFESTLYPNVFWVEFEKIDFSKAAPVMKLDLTGGVTYGGNVTAEFVPTPPFKFLGLDQD